MGDELRGLGKMSLFPLTISYGVVARIRFGGYNLSLLAQKAPLCRHDKGRNFILIYDVLAHKNCSFKKIMCSAGGVKWHKIHACCGMKNGSRHVRNEKNLAMVLDIPKINCIFVFDIMCIVRSRF